MAIIYSKTDTQLGTKNALILGVREAMFRPFNFGAWTEMRVGIFISFTGLAGSNVVPLGETVNHASYLDFSGFGLINGSTTLPGQAIGTQFIGQGCGAKAGGSASLNSGPWILQNGSGGADNVSAIDTTFINGASGLAYIGGVTTPVNPATYAGFNGLRFVVQNPGLSTQTIQCYGSVTADYGGPYTLSNLRSMLNLFAGQNTGSNLVWNQAGAALPLPNYFFFRSSLLNSQVRLHAYECLKIA